jgi:hypothetical protein
MLPYFAILLVAFFRITVVSIVRIGHVIALLGLVISTCENPL